MNDNIVVQFQKKHESLAGIVHRVSGVDEAADQVFSILQEKKTEKAALGELPEDFSQILQQKITLDGLDLLKPPFDNADLPEAFDTIEVGISWAAFAIAETGAIIEFATDDAMRLVTSLPLVHISLARAADLVSTLQEAAPPPFANFTRKIPRTPPCPSSPAPAARPISRCG